MKFNGEIDDLKAKIAGLGYQGEWTEDNGKVIFRAKDGAILNWWPSTETLQCQGPAEPRSKLRVAVKSALELEFEDPEFSQPESENLSSEIASKTNGNVSDLTNARSKRVFVVHGRDDTAREQLELVLHRLQLDPFVLANTSGQGLTIIEALENEIRSFPIGERFGIVLLTPDDMGYTVNNSDNPEPRARQNVVMEMGMLMAAFGRSRVAILKKGHVVVPSDANGIIYLPFNTHVKETVPKLCDRLRSAGFELSPDLITKASV